MNNPNPFVPKGSLLEQQSQRRSRLKLAVTCILAVSVTGLVGMLGCKRTAPDNELNPPSVADTNPPPVLDTNPPPYSVSNPPVVLPPVATNPPVVLPPMAPTPPEAGSSEYVVVKGDSLAKIAKKNGVSLKSLEAANPAVVPTKLKIGQKLVIPAGGKTTTGGISPLSPTGLVAETGGENYTVKSGDTLTKIAKAHGTTVKLLQAANNLTTTKIKVGQKLKIPSKAEAAPAAPATMPAPPVDTAPPLPPSVPATPAPAVPTSH